MKTAIELIQEAQVRQIEKGFDAKYDDEHTCGTIASAAAVYAKASALISCGIPFEFIHRAVATMWPWHTSQLQLSESGMENLAIAGGFIVSEIERLQRLQFPPGANTGVSAVGGACREVRVIPRNIRWSSVEDRGRPNLRKENYVTTGSIGK